MRGRRVSPRAWTKPGIKGKKAALALLLLMLAIAVAVGGTLAAYTHKSFIGGVAATNESRLLFLSDNLSSCEPDRAPGEYPAKRLIAQENPDGSYRLSFNIRNHIGSVVNESNIRYSLSIIPSATETAYVYILHDGTDGEEHSFSTDAPFTVNGYEMAAGESVQHSFGITLPPEALEAGVSFTVAATPDSDSMAATGSYILAAILQPGMLGSVSETASCTGEFADRNGEALPNLLDAFNYSITVSNTTEPISVMLTWNSAYVELDPLFVAKNGLTIDKSSPEGLHSVTFSSENESYMLQFFRKSPKDDLEPWQGSWEAISSVVTVGIVNTE